MLKRITEDFFSEMINVDLEKMARNGPMRSQKLGNRYTKEKYL